MDKFVAIAVGGAWLAIFLMLIWGIASGVRRQLRDSGPLPFFDVLGRYGLSVAQVQEAAGVAQLAQAVRRCALCPDRQSCATPACPNDDLLRRIH